ncbi:lysyl-tRNA synthetase class 2 [Kribbella sp. VKM Ac-2571]|uniref:phosphatidylglycerol lysyltransferase domain-containing protein n=1 Tax=Kribbella sp. VKM Ac-2571 TaxID=2512222 RepID=UPI00105FCA62|nr:phosphatidylglycerol lysyltransferase domain-containing protein [Kribbella sp. VKM Ac-2571]TDO45508.1 lysyl-tRNA synthetase class 2 [Kribbella sp. VKM Ac-2571]
MSRYLSGETRERRDPARWAPWMAGVVCLLGVISVLDAVSPPLRPRLEPLTDVLPVLVPQAAGAAVPLGVVLVLLSRGLARRKRRAWIGALAATSCLLALNGLAHSIGETIAAVVVIVLLWLTRPAFTGRPDPGSTHKVLVTALTSFGLATSVGAGSLVADPDAIRHLSVTQLISEVWLGFIGISGPAYFESGQTRQRLETTLLLLGVVVAVAIVLMALRTARAPRHQIAVEGERLRSLLAEHRNDSLSYFALRDDKALIFAPSGTAAVAYRVVAGVSLASGDPIGDPDARADAVDAWLAEARSYAWTPGVIGASERGAAAYRERGLSAVQLGDEAVLDVATFSLAGRSMRTVRQAAGRAQRRGHTTRIRRVRDIDSIELNELTRHIGRWRAGQAERGYSMALGRFGDPRDDDAVVVSCRDATGELVAVLSLVPWNDDGLSLDLMVRSPTAGNGVIELMVTELLQAAPVLGLARVSLNFAVFREVFERGGIAGAGPGLRLWYRILLGLSRFWQIESLYRANAKYRPAWVARFVCYPRARDLPRIASATLHAESFVRWPRRRSRLPVGHEQKAPV